MLLVSPERLNNPGFRDEVLPRLAATCGLLVVDEAHCISDWGHDFRPDYRRIRTLLGDLPDGIPVLATTATANQRVDRRRRRAARRRHPDAARLARPRVAAARGGPAARRPSSGWPGWPTTSPSSPASASSTASPWPRPRRSPTTCAPAGHAVAAYSGQTEPTERLALEQDLLDGRVKALVATSALGMGFDADPRLRGQPRGAAPRRSPTTSRSAAPVAATAPRTRRWCCCPAIEDRDIWAYFASLAFPREAAGARDARRARRPRAAVDGRPRDARRPRPHPPRDDAQGARRRRCRTPGPGRLGVDRAGVGLRRGALPPGRRGPRARAAGDAGLPRHRRLPDGASCATQLDDPEAEPTAVAATTAAGSRCRPT